MSREHRCLWLWLSLGTFFVVIENCCDNDWRSWRSKRKWFRLEGEENSLIEHTEGHCFDLFCCCLLSLIAEGCSEDLEALFRRLTVFWHIFAILFWLPFVWAWALLCQGGNCNYQESLLLLALALLYYDYDLYLFIRGTSSSATGAIFSASSSSSTLMMWCDHSAEWVGLAWPDCRWINTHTHTQRMNECENWQQKFAGWLFFLC